MSYASHSSSICSGLNPFPLNPLGAPPMLAISAPSILFLSHPDSQHLGILLCPPLHVDSLRDVTFLNHVLRNRTVRSSIRFLHDMYCQCTHFQFHCPMSSLIPLFSSLSKSFPQLLYIPTPFPSLLSSSVSFNHLLSAISFSCCLST